MYGICYAESEQLEDASVMTMLDLLPYNVAHAVAESSMHRYLHSVFAWQTEKPSICLEILQKYAV